MKYFLIAICSWMILPAGFAQKFPDRDPLPKEGFAKKFIWGFSYTQYWSSIQGGPLPKEYFAKPSSGILVSAEYFPLSFLGIGLGAGYQQRGAGITHQHIPAYADSSYRERLRFNTIELPISVVLRTPKDIVRGLRFSGTMALVPMINLHSHDVLNVLEPSVNDTNIVKDVSSAYFKNDTAFQLTLGPELDYGSGIFRIHFAFSQGTANVYQSGQGKGHNQTIGFRLSAMF